MTFTLRNYQSEAVAAGMASNNGILLEPTGSGKSHIIANIVKQSEGRTLVLQPSKEILQSNFDKAVAAGILGASIYSASMNCKQVGERCTYATIGSIIKKLRLFHRVENLIIDECHLVNSKGGQYQQLISMLKPKRLLGLSATPYRLHTTSMGSDMRMLHRTRPKMFNAIVHITQTRDLVNQGYLMQPRYIVTSCKGDKTQLRLNTAGSEYTEKSVAHYLAAMRIHKRVGEAAQHALEQGRKHLLVFVPSVMMAEKVVAHLVELGISARSVSTKTPDKVRDKRFRRFQAGLLTALVNVGVATTGYDFPALDCVICARPTLSLSLYYQIIGRCVRPSEGKPEPLVYDLVDNFRRFGDPMQYQVVETTPGCHVVLSDRGRLTGVNIDRKAECESRVGFGMHSNKRLCDVPDDYIDWFLTTERKSNRWHMMAAEKMRRELYYREEAGAAT